MKLLAFFLAITLLISGCGIREIPQEQINLHEAWAKIYYFQAKKYELITSILKTTKVVAEEEKDVFLPVIEELKILKVSIPKLEDLGDAERFLSFFSKEKQLETTLNPFFHRIDTYPGLKTREDLIELREKLQKIETRLKWAKDDYQRRARDYNQFLNRGLISITNFILYNYKEIYSGEF